MKIKATFEEDQILAIIEAYCAEHIDVRDCEGKWSGTWGKYPTEIKVEFVEDEPDLVMEPEVPLN